MEKQRKITLNADKRKVIADQFQSFYEDKIKDKLVQAKEQYDIIREKAKEVMNKVGDITNRKKTLIQLER